MELVEKIKIYNGTIVLRDFDNGYQIFFWFVPMLKEEFELWWINQETFTVNSPEWAESTEKLTKIFNELYESKPVSVFDWPGEILAVETEEMSKLWTELYGSGQYHFCHVYSDTDSFIITPEGKYLYHKGYCGDKRDDKVKQ